jgi:hypothetical protein
VVEAYYSSPNQDLFSVPAAGGPLDTAVNIDGPVGSAALGADGAVAFRGFVNPPQPRSYQEQDIYVWRAGKLTNLTADYDFDVDGGVLGDQAPPRGGEGSSPIVWAADGKSVVVATT